MNHAAPSVARAFPHVLCASVLSLLAPTTSRAGDCAPQWLPGETLPGADSFIDALTLWDPDGPGPRSPVVVFGGAASIFADTIAKNAAMFDPQTGAIERLGDNLGAYINQGSNSGSVTALTVLPDGSLIACGAFSGSGNPTYPSNIARWTGATWTHLGTSVADSGLLNWVQAMTPGLDGSLYVGGHFTYRGRNIVRWDGAAWAEVGGGIIGDVNALVTMPNGDIIAAGDIVTAGGLPFSKIVRWNGSAWSSLASGLNGPVHALLLEPSGNLIAAGAFTSASGLPVSNIARWNGAAWSVLDSGLPGTVKALTRLPNGDIFAAGLSPSPQTTHQIARWDGDAWTVVGSEFRGEIRALLAVSDQDVFASGRFTAVNDKPASFVARWLGDDWKPIAPGIHGPFTKAILAPDGDLLIGAGYTASLNTGTPTNGAVLKYDGAHYTPIGPEANGQIHAITLRAGEIIAGGAFTQFGSAQRNHIARWDGAQWQPLALGVNGTVTALTVDPNGGDLLVGGQFTSAGGLPITNLARWNGAQWSNVAPALSGPVYDIHVLSNGHILVAGAFNLSGGVQLRGIGRWDGEVWQRVGTQLGDGTWIKDIIVQPNGDIYAAGFLVFGEPAQSYAQLAKWNGAQWTAAPGLQSGLFRAESITQTPNGEIYAAGDMRLAPFGQTTFVVRWDSQTSGLSPVSTDTSDGVIWWPKANELFTYGRFHRPIPSFVSSQRARWTETNTPWLAQQPQQQVAQLSGAAAFTATPALGFADLSATWQLESAPHSNVFVNLTDGPIPGAEPATASITQLLPTIRPGDTTLTINNATQALHNRRVRAIIDNACGVAISNTASLYIGQAPCPGDANGDNVVNFVDLNLVLSFFGQTVAPGTNGDLNDDGAVNFQDLNLVLSFFGTGC